jgi:replication factor C subunit 3/5
MALLREIFGKGIERVRMEHKAFKTPSGKAIEMVTIASAYHIEINPGDAGIYDRFVVQDVIKEMAASVPIFSGGLAGTGSSAAASNSSGAGNFKVVLLSEVDRMTKEAQAALRRTMEKYSATTRLILISSSPSRVIEPVRSRCLGIRVGAPTQQEIITLLTATATKENLQLPMALAAKIAAQSGRNLRRAILMLEAAKAQTYPFSPTQQVPLMDYEVYIKSLSQIVCSDQSPTGLIACRSKVYDLVVNCIPADVIVKRLIFFILDRIPAEHDIVKHEIINWTSHYEHRMNLGQKEVFHIDALIARLMLLLKQNKAAIGPARQ